MKILRWLGLLIAVSAFSFFLWVLSIDVGVVHEVSQPSNIKKIVSDSGLYNNVVTTFLSQKDSNGNAATIKIGDDDVALSDPVVKAAAVKALPPEFIQQNVEQVIDGFSSWLNGETSTPQFKVDLTHAKATFGQELASGVQTRLTGLPACTDGSTAVTFNPFTATCLPKGVTPASAAASVQSEVASSTDFIKDTVLTADDLKDQDGKPVFSSLQAQDGRHTYDRIKKSPIYIALFALLAAVGIFFLSSTRRRGLRRIGIVLTVMGIITLLFMSLMNSAIKKAAATDSDPTVRAFQESGIKAGKSFITDLSHIYYPLGTVYTILGVGLIVGSIVVKRGGSGGGAAETVIHKPTILDEPDSPTADEELAPEPKKPAAKKPAAKPKAKPAAKPKPAPKPAVTKIQVS